MNRAANDNNLARKGRGIAYAAQLNGNTAEYMADRISYDEFSKRSAKIWRAIESDGVTREVQAALLTANR